MFPPDLEHKYKVNQWAFDPLFGLVQTNALRATDISFWCCFLVYTLLMHMKHFRLVLKTRRFCVLAEKNPIQNFLKTVNLGDWVAQLVNLKALGWSPTLGSLLNKGVCFFLCPPHPRPTCVHAHFLSLKNK